MSTPREIPGARPQVGVGRAAPLARSVSEDLTAIFPEEPRRQAATPVRIGRRRADRGAVTQRGKNRAANVGAIAAAVLVGVSAGALLARGPTSAWPGASSRPPAMAFAALPSPGPLPAGPLHAALARGPVAAAPAPATLRTVAARARAGRHKRTAAAHRVSTCRGSHCRSSSVMAADARLRRAYASAVAAGVSRTVLADYHDQWAHLRRQAPRRPALVAARYGEMAKELTSMAAGRHRVVDTARTRPGPLRSLRTQIAALWR